MPIGVPQGNLDIKNATLRTSNLETQNIKIGSIFVGTGNSLEETANVGNSMSNTIQFTNTHTAFTTTGNVSVGKDLTVSGNVEVAKELTVTGNATVSSNLTVSGNVEVVKELTVTGNATVNGTLGQNGKEIYAQRRWEIDLTSLPTATFYPIEFTHPTVTNLPDFHPVHFKVFGESLPGSDSYNENTLVGYAKGGGWSDHGPMYDVHICRFVGGVGEDRFQGIYEGDANYIGGFVIYMRGGYKYSALTDASQVITHTSAYTTTGTDPNYVSTFALKDSNGADTSGTSIRISQLVNLSGNNGNDIRWMSGFLLPKAFAFFADGTGGSFTNNVALMKDVSTLTVHFDSHPNPNGIYRGFREQSGDGNRGMYFAPVKGIYHFTCKARIPDNLTNQYEIEWYIKRNGNYSPAYAEEKYTSFEMWASPADGGGRRSHMSSTMVYLDVDEGIFPRNDNPTVTCSIVTFGGHFLGTY